MNNWEINNKVLIFGVSGFIGSEVTKAFLHVGSSVTALSRSPIAFKDKNLSVIKMDFGNFNIDEFKDIHTVIYCAGIAHNKYKDENLTYANLSLPKFIAEQCRDKVKRFIFISTVNVLDLKGNTVLSSESNVNPIGANALSKYAAECALRSIFENTSSNLTIVRCPMVYGHNAPGNFTLLKKLAGYPLPFKNNKTIRSMLYIANLVDLIFHLVSFDKKLPLIFIASDSNPLQFNTLLQKLSIKQGKKSRLFHINHKIMTVTLRVLGQDNIRQLFYNNLIIDSQVYDSTFTWTPKLSHEQGLEDYFLTQEQDIT